MQTLYFLFGFALGASLIAFMIIVAAIAIIYFDD